MDVCTKTDGNPSNQQLMRYFTSTTEVDQPTGHITSIAKKKYMIQLPKLRDFKPWDEHKIFAQFETLFTLICTTQANVDLFMCTHIFAVT